MNSLLGACSSALSVNKDWLCCLQDERVVRKTEAPPAATGLQLALRIGYAPCEESAGARLGPFGLSDDIAISELNQTKALEPLEFRQELANAGRYGSRSHWPDEEERFRVQYNYFKAKVVVSDGAQGFEEHWCLVQAAASPKDRTMEVAKASVEDSVTAATYAHKFNSNTAQLHAEEEGGEHDAETVVGVRVCIPVACFVLGGMAQEVAQPGQVILVTKFPFQQVKKFVFDGKEEFLELPHAFFHYASWLSGGHEVIGDIQGAEDEDGDIHIVDPVILRPAQASVGSLLGALAANKSDSKETEPKEKLRFDLMHPRCGPLCKTFDPLRRAPHGGRKHCGLSVPSCGVGGA